MFEHSQKNKMQTIMFTEITSLRHGYDTRLSHIFAACNSHKYLAVPKTIPELNDALQRI